MMATAFREAYRAVATSFIVTGVTWLAWTLFVVPDETCTCHPPLIMWVVSTLIGVVMLLRRRNRDR